MVRHFLECEHQGYYDLLNPYIVGVGYHRAEPGDAPGRNFGLLSDFDLWYVCSGAGRVLLDGEWEYFLRDDVIFLKPGHVFRDEEIVAPATGYEIYWVRFLPFGQRNAELDRRLAGDLPRKLPLALRPDVDTEFRELFELVQVRAAGYQLKAKARVLAILASALSPEGRSEEEVRSLPGALSLRRAVLFMEEHYREPISLSEVADRCGLSVSHLCHLFRRRVHQSPIEYLIDHRLGVAKKLLMRGLSVTEAAEGAGFGSIHHFSRIFRDRHGISPVEFAGMGRDWLSPQLRRGERWGADEP